MRKNVKFISNAVENLNPEMSTARFENVKTQDGLSTGKYTDITVYGGIKTTNYKSDGNAELSAFREALISLRTQLKNTTQLSTNATVAKDNLVGFIVYLKVENEEKKDEPYYIQVYIYRKVVSFTTGTFKLGDDEYGCIKVITNLEKCETDSDTNTYSYGMKDLIVDSDIDDRIWRFVGENEWRSTTYLILDMNKNLSINKGAYLTLNTAFNNNIGWYEPVRKGISGWSKKDIDLIQLLPVEQV